MKKEDIIITHYGCSSFDNPTHNIYWIGALSFVNNKKEYFFENDTEVEIIEKYYNYLNERKDKTIIHWSMDVLKYGFTAIEKRYKELTNKSIKFCRDNLLDMSEYLKEKYGEDYVSREGGRLNNLAKLNSFTGLSTKKEVKSFNDGCDRLELLFSVYNTDKLGTLKVENTNVSKATKNHPAKIYALTYILDCHATGQTLPIGQKKEIERIGNEKTGYTGTGNTFYKAFNSIINSDLNDVSILVNIAGSNWRNIVLELSKDTTTLENYLNEKHL